MLESPLYLFAIDEAAIIGLLEHIDSHLPVATDVG